MQVQSIVGHTWFDESNLVETLGEARHERQRRCGFANMLFGSCNVNWSATVVLNTLRRWPLWHPFSMVHSHRDGIGTGRHGTIAILRIGQRVWISRRVSGGECPMLMRTMTLMTKKFLPELEGLNGFVRWPPGKGAGTSRAYP